jgi:hypothetical protein
VRWIESRLAVVLGSAAADDRSLAAVAEGPGIEAESVASAGAAETVSDDAATGRAVTAA